MQAGSEGIERLVHEILGERNVLRVEVEPSVNNDDEQVLRVTVVLPDDHARPAVESMNRLVRSLRGFLAENDSAAFPVLSYVDNAEVTANLAAQ